MSELIKFVSGLPSYISLPLMPTVFLWLVALPLRPWKDAGNRRFLWLSYNQLQEKMFYLTTLTRVLNSVDRRVSYHEVIQNHPPTSPSRAWNANLLYLTLLFAIVYPMWSAYGQWVAGDAPRLGDVTIADTTTPFVRIKTLALLIILFVCLYFLKYYTRIKSWVHFPVFLAVSMILFALISTFGDAGAILFGYAISIFVAVAGAGVVAGAMAGAFAGAFAVAGAVNHLERRKIGHSVVLRLSFILILFAILSIAIGWFWRPENTSFEQSLVLFLFIFPVLNGVSDFASIGLTRFCLRQGLNGRAIVWGIVDVVGGLVIFALLGMSIIAYVHYVQTPNGPLITLETLFDGLHSAPREYVWIMVMFGSTLLPTLLHFILILIAGGYLLIPHIPPLYKGLQSSASIPHMLALFFVILFWVMCFYVPYAAITWILGAYDHAILFWVLSIFEEFARGIGAISPTWSPQVVL